MAIRDGKTVTETVRSRPLSREGGGEDAHRAETTFEELTLLDSAGRLQLPQAYREALAITDRFRWR